jgi:membrane peptidoglycan carboxypeptidase
MLEGPPRRGTAQKTLGNFPRPIAGKTGTTDHSQDAWYIGYTPQLTAAVWMGNPLNEETMVINGSQVFGADYPARIWGAFMRVATQNLPPLDFTPPDPSLWHTPKGINEYGRNGAVASQSSPSKRPVAPAPAPPPPPSTTPPTSVRPSPTTAAKVPKKPALPRRPRTPTTRGP